jgi:hypothetical protein
VETGELAVEPVVGSSVVITRRDARALSQWDGRETRDGARFDAGHDAASLATLELRAGLKPEAGPTDPPQMTRDQDPNRRNHRRRLRPLSCEIELADKVHSGVIRDLSPQGLFVTSRFEAAPGTAVTVRVRRPGGEVWEIQATAARHADGARALISRRGLGLVIEEAPAAFHEFVAELGGGSLEPLSTDEPR